MQKFKVLSTKKQRKTDKAVRMLFPRPAYERLRAAFSESDARSREGYALVQAGHRADHSHKNGDYLARSLHVPAPEDLFEQSSITVTPRAEFLEAILSEAAEKNNALVELHTHVGSREPTFSWIDIENGLENGRFLRSCGLRFAMAVVGSDGFSFCEYDADQDALLIPESSRISVVGRNGVKDALVHGSRTSCAFRPAPGLEGMRVAIAGLDGSGFGIIYLLARQGIKNFVLFDHGVIGKDSAGILPYAPEAGKKKTRAASSMLKQISGDIVASHVPDAGRNARGALKDCDVIFSCGPDEKLRSLVTEASLKYFIPCIDATALRKNDPEGLYGRVQVFIPAITGCPTCHDRGAPAKAGGPASAMVNGVLASIAVQEFMDLVTGHGAEKPYDRIEYDPVTLAIDRKISPMDAACPKCGRNGVLGAGDERKKTLR